ncbi:MAG: hypothetical protein OEZ10_09975 [Gammaproteobacteria bacterium]|nr:hypothetical protein [Gammaproteobacteria bacterium]
MTESHLHYTHRPGHSATRSLKRKHCKNGSPESRYIPGDEIVILGLPLTGNRKLAPVLTHDYDPPKNVDSGSGFDVRIYTLGRFSLVLNNQPVHFTTKSKKKPLELLKALVAFGGREVGEAHLSDALWPGHDGDAAHRALATTLHRLRKLLRKINALEHRDAKLSLSPEFCWIDSWQFERLIGDTINLNTEHSDWNVANRLERAIKLYKGPFLGVEEPQAWDLLMRERLRSKYIRALHALGRYYRYTGNCEQSIITYETALETDGLAESLYRGLMLCYAGNGDRAKALAVFHRCRETLFTVLGVSPSRELRALYDSFRRGDTGKADEFCFRCRNTGTKQKSFNRIS